MEWQYGDYTIWNFAIRKRHRPRRCRTRAMKTCQRRINRIPEIAGTEVMALVHASRRASS